MNSARLMNPGIVMATALRGRASSWAAAVLLTAVGVR